MSTSEISAFPRSKRAASTAERTGSVRQAFIQAYGAPENYLAYVSSGEHPLVIWINHLQMTAEIAAEAMKVPLSQYESLLGDTDGAFHKITPAMVLNFCDYSGIHPAHLGSLVPDYRCALPPAILAANLRMMEDVQYSAEDRALAQCAVKAERNRYHDGTMESFVGNPEFGRVAEKLEAFWADWEITYLLHKELGHTSTAWQGNGAIWFWDANASVALENIKENLEEKIADNDALMDVASAGIKKRTEGFYKMFGDIVRQETRTTNAMAIVARSVGIVKECAKQFDIVGERDQTRLKNSLASIIAANFGKKNSSTIQMAAQMCIYFFEDRGQTADYIKQMERRNDDLRDELENTREWIDRLGDRSDPKGRVVSWLFANRCLRSEYDHMYSPDPKISALLQARPKSWGS